MSAKMKPDTTKLAGDTESDAAPESKKVKDPDLAEFIDVFGTEKGLELYQSEADITEVRQLKELLDKYGVPGKPEAAAETTALNADAPASGADDEEKKDEEKKEEEKTTLKADDEKTSLKAEVSSLRQEITGLANDVKTLRAAFPRGETAPLNHGLTGGDKKAELQKASNSSIDRYAAQIKVSR